MNRPHPFRVIFYPGSGLGDTVLSLPVLHFVHQQLGGPIDIATRQSPDMLRDIYAGLDFIGEIHGVVAGHEGAVMDAYDVVIVANEQVQIQIKEHVQPHLQSFIQIVQRGFARRQDFGVVNNVVDLLSNQLANHAVLLGLKRWTLPLYSLGADDYASALPCLPMPTDTNDTLQKFGLSSRHYITLHDGWDANFPGQGNVRPTKAWLPDRWAATVAAIKAQRPQTIIVQLGSTKTGEAIAGVDHNLRGQTSLRESFALLAHAALHIDIEGGLVHAAHALGTRSMVLFGPTHAKFFGYDDNINLVPPCTNCWWLKADWMKQCVRGLPQPECMHSHKPEVLAQTVLGALAA